LAQALWPVLRRKNAGFLVLGWGGGVAFFGESRQVETCRYTDKARLRGLFGIGVGRGTGIFLSKKLDCR